jgi:uncharacterized caspase-like protein
VGVNRYQDPSTPDLPECKPDVVDTRTALVGSVMWGSSGSNITVLTDTQPTKSAVRNAILAQAGTYGPHDLFLLVISSHGTNYEGQGYLIPYDGGSDPDTFISGAELKTWLTSLRAPGQNTNICVFIDACYSGLLIGKGLEGDNPLSCRAKFVMKPGSKPLASVVPPTKQIEQMTDAIAITACLGSEISLTAPSLGHSLCMHYLITGLGNGSVIGPADPGHTGHITMTQLYNYAQPKVVDYASQIPHEQHPQIYKGTDAADLIKM